MESENPGEQEKLPDVPQHLIPCDCCGEKFTLHKNEVPLYCPHCREQLRPRTCSMWNHFVFVLSKRLLNWKGRATRKEYWSYILYGSLLFIISIFFCGFFLFHIGVVDLRDILHAYIFSALSIFISYLFILAIPLYFLRIRRLHDISISGKWVFVYLIADILTILYAVAPIVLLIYEYKELVQMFEEFVADSFIISNESSIYCEIDFKKLSCFTNTEQIMNIRLENPYYDNMPMTICVLVLNIANWLFDLFFLIAAFIDGTKGTNKFGFSRKYPYAV